MDMTPEQKRYFELGRQKERQFTMEEGQLFGWPMRDWQSLRCKLIEQFNTTDPRELIDALDRLALQEAVLLGQ